MIFACARGQLPQLQEAAVATAISKLLEQYMDFLRTSSIILWISRFGRFKFVKRRRVGLALGGMLVPTAIYFLVRPQNIRIVLTW